MFDRDKLKADLATLAAHGVYIGTSSWKYPGWCGMLYEYDRYVTRGKFSTARFERDCLAEYAQVFKTVCVDAAYYKFPDERYLQNMVLQVPGDFLFSYKVTDEITVKRFTNLPRFGPRAGKANENFLNPDLFASAFVRPFEQFKNNVGVFIFEFSKFYKTDYEHGRDFAADLDRFFEHLPKGWRYGIEIRNPYFLHADYFAMLARHGVAHIFNSWGKMMPIDEQVAMPDSITNPEFSGGRLLLKPGRSFEDAIKLFSPYDRLQEPYDAARAGAAELIKRAQLERVIRNLLLYVNNRLEGNALLTIRAILDRLAAIPPQAG